MRVVRARRVRAAWLWTVALAAGVSGCAGKPADKPAPPPREVEVLRLAAGEVRETGEYLGNLASRQSVTVFPQVAGYVRRIHVRPGQSVQAGDALLEVDARQESAALESAQAGRTSAVASLELARQTRARSESMHKEGLLSAQELERAVAQAEAAEAAARAAAAQVARAQVQLQFHVVRAPFAGTLGDVLVRVGDAVGASTPLTSVAQADALEVSVAVPAERARTLAPGAPLEVLDSKGQVLLSSPVFFVAPQADPRTQLVEVKAAFRNGAALRPSELVRARLVYATRQALQLPAAAVVRQSGQAFAFVVQEKAGQARVERRPVTLGALGEAAYVVERGLQEGDVVASSSLHLLRDGAPVRPRPAAGAEANAGQAPSGGGGIAGGSH
ncbi:MAG: efflux RND transporter periplasmic adaptor subunit [Myxococcaceae bacterium]|nr:efflux RND transporter periplasmic adaptor subunit [Myxococcaceae bacterium]